MLIPLLLLQMGFTAANPVNNQNSFVPRGSDGYSFASTESGLSKLSSAALAVGTGTGSFATGLWIRSDMLTGSTVMGLMTNVTGANTDWSLSFLQAAANDRLYAQCCDTVAGCTGRSEGAVTLRTGDVHLVLFVHDSAAKTCTIYVDNVKGTVQTLANGLRDLAADFIIGSRSAGTSFTGSLDTAFYLSGMPTQAQLDSIWNQGKGGKCNTTTFTGTVVACWDLEESSGNRVNNLGTCGATCDLTAGGTSAQAPGLMKSQTNVVVP